MALYRHSGVSVESWVEMTECVPMRYEIDSRNDRVALYFGQEEDYVLVLRRDNLRQMATLADQAITALDPKLAHIRQTQPNRTGFALCGCLVIAPVDPDADGIGKCWVCNQLFLEPSPAGQRDCNGIATRAAKV